MPFCRKLLRGSWHFVAICNWAYDLLIISLTVFMQVTSIVHRVLIQGTSSYEVLCQNRRNMEKSHG